MNRQFDLAPKRKRLGLTQREVESGIEFPAGSLGAIEDGRIGIDEETYRAINDTIDRLIREKGEGGCEKEVMETDSGST